MAEQSISFFATEVLRSPQGKKCLLISVIWGILAGGVLPASVASFTGHLGAKDIAFRAGLLIVLVVLVNIFKRYKEWKTTTTLVILKQAGQEAIAEKLLQAPFAITEESSKTRVSRFLSAQRTAIWLVINDGFSMAASLFSFVFVLVLYGMPWWLYALVGVVVALAVAGYWWMRNFKQFKLAGDLESKAGDLIAELCDSRNNKQAQPALMRAFKDASNKAFEARIKSNRYTLLRFHDPRNLMGAAISCAAVIAAASTSDPVTATLLVVFMFTFSSSYIEAIHAAAERLDTVQSDGAPLVNDASQPVKPLLHPQPGKLCLQASNVRVQYPGKEGKPGHEVVIPNLELRNGSIYVFTGENGSGKSSLFKATEGEVEYTGDLFLWGQPVSAFDCSETVNGFQQNRTSLSPTVEGLFRNKQGEFDAEVRQYALWCVNAEAIDLTHEQSKLSGGQQQKIDLALVIYRSITKQPGLVIIDEPTNNLDRPTVALVRERLPQFIAKHVGPDRTVMIAAHDTELQEALLSLPRSQEVV